MYGVETCSNGWEYLMVSDGMLFSSELGIPSYQRRKVPGRPGRDLGNRLVIGFQLQKPIVVLF